MPNKANTCVAITMRRFYCNILAVFLFYTVIFDDVCGIISDTVVSANVGDTDSFVKENSGKPFVKEPICKRLRHVGAQSECYPVTQSERLFRKNGGNTSCTQ